MRNIQLSEVQAKEWVNKGGELKELALQAYPELNRATKWEDCKRQKGYYINYFSEIKKSRILTNEDENLFATENQAKAVLALAQLTQLYWNWYRRPMPKGYLEPEFREAFPNLINEWNKFAE